MLIGLIRISQKHRDVELLLRVEILNLCIDKILRYVKGTRLLKL